MHLELDCCVPVSTVAAPCRIGKWSFEPDPRWPSENLPAFLHRGGASKSAGDRLNHQKDLFLFNHKFCQKADKITCNTCFPILHGAEMWKRGHNNLIRDALVFIPFKVGK